MVFKFYCSPTNFEGLRKRVFPRLSLCEVEYDMYSCVNLPPVTPVDSQGKRADGSETVVEIPPLKKLLQQGVGKVMKALSNEEGLRDVVFTTICDGEVVSFHNGKEL